MKPHRTVTTADEDPLLGTEALTEHLEEAGVPLGLDTKKPSSGCLTACITETA